MSEENTEAKTQEPNVYISPNDALVVLNALDIAIKAPNTDVNSLAIPKLALQNEFISRGVLEVKKK